jgi:hypothetical protein
MNNSRDYIDQIINFIASQVRQRKDGNLPLTEEFFKSEVLKSEAKETINTIIDLFRYSAISNDDFENYFNTALVEYTSNHPIDIIASTSLKKNQKKTWLDDRRYAETSWNYTSRYFHYLKKNGRAEKVLNETYNSSRRILEKLGDPKSTNEFYVRGLVVGSVQSGKTANFNAVINRAIDSGYALIIVLSGIMEDLRSQTQRRIEKEVSGTDKSNAIGVGVIKKFGELGDPSVHQVVVPTSIKHDFKKTIKEADFSLNNKNILVCKKNVGVLKNLILWLDEYLSENKDKHDIPFLIIDDESDNASLNNMGKKGKEYASKINGYIRALLGLFNRKTYLGYTATPFANVLQDRNEAPVSKWEIDYKEKGEVIKKAFDLVDNIFPEDFIELLFPPSNYIGAKHFFETRIEEVKKIEPLVPPAVSDYYDCFPTRVKRINGQVLPASVHDKSFPKSTKDDPFPNYLPESLKEAIQCFVISVAIRLSRKAAMINSKLYNPHNSMLIHVSRFTAWQTRTKILVERYVNDELSVKLNTSLPSNPKSIYAEFERTWYKYYAHVIENIKTYLPDGYDDDFLVPRNFIKDIKPLLVEAIKGIEIKAVNSETKDNLIYPDNAEIKYIAIGGNRLSRGFTLEGLTINYFIRNTDYADTLLQMGRWFGYRPGYIDCCKLFTTPENIRKFDLTTVTIEELEEEFKIMSKKNRKPKDFVLRVKTHPKVLQITRSSILKKTIQEKVDFSGDIEQSTKFLIDKSRIERSWNSFKNYLKKVEWEVDSGKDFFIFRTDSKGLLNLLNLENTFIDFETQGLPEWLNLCNTEGKLTNWTIAIKRNTETQNPLLKKEVSGLPQDMRLTIRRGPKIRTNVRQSLIENDVFKASGKSATIVAAGSDFSLTLSAQEKRKAELEFKKSKVDEFVRSNIPKDYAEEKASKMTVPDRAYRIAMSEKDGILIIYLIDLARVFEVKEGVIDTELVEYASKKGLDMNIPLVGYAIGFPKLSGNIGGTYVRGDYQLELPFEDVEENEDEFDEELVEENI